MKPYLAIDIETTGIDIICEVLQIAAIYDNGEENISDMKTFEVKIKHENFVATPSAMIMNHDLILEIENSKSDDVTTPAKAAIRFCNFLSGIFASVNKVTIAGKNVAVFDVPRLERFVNKYHPSKKWAEFDWNYRCLDIGSLYFPDFGEVVSLSRINGRIGRKDVSHDALDDTKDVVYAIRNKIGNRIKWNK